MAAPNTKRPLLHCSFCGHDSVTVRKLIAGPGVYICDACIEKCNRILRGEAEQPEGGDRDADASNDQFGGWEKLSDKTLLGAIKGTNGTIQSIADILQTQIDVLRARKVSWSAIGGALGVSRQAAWERFGKD